MCGSRPNWGEYFMDVAEACARRADCTRRRVGAVIVDIHKRIIATGYNGAPSGEPGCLTDGACPRWQSNVEPGSSYDTGEGACIAIHAEQNALLHSNLDARRGGTMYVTALPCDGCFRMLKASGLSRIVFPNGELMIRESK